MARGAEILVVKGFAPTTDAGVPDFGPFHPDPRPITLRRSTPDTVDKKARERLYTSAINRALHFAYGDVTDEEATAGIQLQFPHAEHIQNLPFERSHWAAYGNMESERARVDLMLDIYPERSFPTALDGILQPIVETARPLEAWRKAQPKVAFVAERLYKGIQQDMIARIQPDTIAKRLWHEDGYHNAYQSDPIHYSHNIESRDREKQIWENALTQITTELQGGDMHNVAAFLSLYGRIKDPITPLTSTLTEQAKIFKRLYRETQAHLSPEDKASTPTNERAKTLVTQLALESSFLALPLAHDVFYVRGDAEADSGGRHQELPYVYVRLKDLPRGEFTNPYAVVPRIRELIDDFNQRGRLVVTPLAVSHIQEPGVKTPTTFLIDGNNRATSLMVMQYLFESGVSYEDRLDQQKLDTFMKKHHLHTGWEREIALTLAAEKSYTDSDGDFHEGFTPEVYGLIMQAKDRIQPLIDAKVPALLLSEPDFHTVIVDRAVKNRPDLPLLQPMHQAIYNADGVRNKQGKLIAVAIPPKNQTHGRAMGNNIRVGVEPLRHRPTFVGRRHRLQPVRATASQIPVLTV